MNAKAQATETGAETLCFAQGRAGEWEAICVDFDIAVQGASFREVQRELELAIQDYVEALGGEDLQTRAKLLRRRAPRLTAFRWSIRVLVSAFRHFAGDDTDTTASFPISVPA